MHFPNPVLRRLLYVFTLASLLGLTCLMEIFVISLHQTRTRRDGFLAHSRLNERASWTTGFIFDSFVKPQQ